MSSSPGDRSAGERSTCPSGPRVIDQPLARVRSGSSGAKSRLGAADRRARPLPALGARGGRPAARSPATCTSAERRCERAAPVIRPRCPRAGDWRRRGPPATHAGIDRRPPPAAYRCDRAPLARSSTGAGPGSTRRSSWRATLRTPRVAMAAQVLSRRPARAPTRATSSWAQAVGVLAEVWATSSATEVSTSWPTPVSDGNRAGGDGTRDGLVVEGNEVGASPAATDEREHVERVGAEHPDGGRDRAWRVGALHARVDAEHLEREPAAAQLVEEVGLGRGALARDQADPQRGERASSGCRWRPAAPRRRGARGARRGRPRAGPACRRGRWRSSGAAAGHAGRTSRAGPGCARRCRRSSARPRRPR